MACRLMEASTHPDYTEIAPDGAFIKIERIRDIIKTVARSSVRGGKRVFVIDDAHKLNAPAANALLKVLEEPPPDTYFILVAPSAKLLLSTVVSRCVTVRFGLLSDEEVATVLGDNGVERAREMALLAEGSAGRAMTMYRDNGMALYDDAASFTQNISVMSLWDALQKSESMHKMPKEQITEWFMYLNIVLRNMLTGDATSPLSKRRLFGLAALCRRSMDRLSANVNVKVFLDGFFIEVLNT